MEENPRARGRREYSRKRGNARSRMLQMQPALSVSRSVVLCSRDSVTWGLAPNQPCQELACHSLILRGGGGVGVGVKGKTNLETFPTHLYFPLTKHCVCHVQILLRFLLFRHGKECLAKCKQHSNLSSPEPC